MSRGGFRGRGRGGADRGMPPGGFGSLSRAEWTEAMQNMRTSNKYSGMLYPPLDNKATSHLTVPTPHEFLIIDHTISLNRTLTTGKGLDPSSSATATATAGEGQAPWRLASERKVVGIEIESYSDRFKRQDPANAAGPSKLDPAALHLDPTMFPPVLWNEYFDEAAEKPKAKKPKKKRKLDDLEADDGANANPEQEEESDSPGETSDENFDFDDDESDDHGDYDHNYFDNGEGDDDEGGDSGNEGMGGFDD